MPLVVANRRRQRLGREKRRLDGFAPALETWFDELWADISLAIFPERYAFEPELLRLLFFAIDRSEERTAFHGKS